MKPFKFALALFIVITALAALPAAGSQALGPKPEPEPAGATPTTPAGKYAAFLPFVTNHVGVESACDAIPGARFDPLPVLPPPSDRPADQHADLNLSLRHHQPTDAARDYILIDGPTDPHAPDLSGLFVPARRPLISATAQVFDWDWDCNCRTTPLQSPAVTYLGLNAAPQEILHVPPSGYDIGWGYEVLVLYAEPYQITLKYTLDDNVVSGYTLHLQNICVESRLLSLYESLDANGRRQLPALKPGQAFARAQGDSVGVAIRDTGRFMDPRSLKDWW